MPMRFSTLPLLLAALAAGCTTWRPQTAPAPQVVAAQSDGSVRVLRRDQSTLVLRHPQVVGDSIVGDAGDPPRRVAVATADVQRLEVRRVSAVRTGGLGIGVLVAVTCVAVVAATVALLSAWN
jgi:hypothetical protein